MRELVRFAPRPLPLAWMAKRLGYSSHHSLTTLADRYERAYGLAPDQREKPEAYATREKGQEGFSLVAA